MKNVSYTEKMYVVASFTFTFPKALSNSTIFPDKILKQIYASFYSVKLFSFK